MTDTGGEQQRAEHEQFRKFALEELKLSAEFLERDRDGEYTHYRIRKYWHVWQAAYSLGWDTAREESNHMEEALRKIAHGPLSQDCHFCNKTTRYSGHKEITNHGDDCPCGIAREAIAFAEKQREAIRAIPKPSGRN